MTIAVDATTEPVNLTWTCGDNVGQLFRLLVAADEGFDLRGILIRAEARGTLGNAEALTVSLPDPEAGYMALHDPGLEPDVYDYDVQFTPGATWIRGRLRIRKDVTV